MRRFSFGLRSKMAVAFLAAGLIPYLLGLWAVQYQNEQHITQTIRDEFALRTTDRAQKTSRQLSTLQRDLEFLAGYDVLTDIVTGDLDMRIASVLEKKLEIWNLTGRLMCTDGHGRIVAATERSDLHRRLGSIRSRGVVRSELTDRFVLRLSVPVRASFDPARTLGYLVFDYDLDNLKNDLEVRPGEEAFFVDPRRGLFVGGEMIRRIGPFGDDAGVTETADRFVGYSRLSFSAMKGWYYVVTIPKKLAFAHLDLIRTTFLQIAVIGAWVMLIVAYFAAGGVIRPIRALRDTVGLIMDEEDYSRRVPVGSHDEVGELSYRFNELAAQTETLLVKLRHENDERLRLFIRLIEIFNDISETVTAQEAIDVAVRQMESFWGRSGGIVFMASDDHPDRRFFSLGGERGGFAVDAGLVETTLHEKFFLSVALMIALQIERIELLERTEASSRAKSSFIANMSHELRTPLNSIIGFSQFLQGVDEIPQEYRAPLKNIERAGYHLLEMINDILDLAKIEAGKLDIHPEPFAVDEVVAEVGGLMFPLTAARGLTLRLPDATGIVVDADRRYTRQILVNLLSNAVKFTYLGEIAVDIRCDRDAVTILIRDSGVGLDIEDLELLFEDFVQIENPMQKKNKGTGLGLALSRKMAAAMGGSVTLESRGRGSGTTAILQIPLHDRDKEHDDA